MSLVSFFEFRFFKETCSSEYRLKDSAPKWLKECLSNFTHTNYLYDIAYSVCATIDNGEMNNEYDIYRFVVRHVDMTNSKLHKWFNEYASSFEVYEADEILASNNNNEFISIDDHLQYLQYEVINKITCAIFNAWQENQDKDEEFL